MSGRVTVKWPAETLEAKVLINLCVVASCYHHPHLFCAASFHASALAAHSKGVAGASGRSHPQALHSSNTTSGGFRTTAGQGETASPRSAFRGDLSDFWLALGHDQVWGMTRCGVHCGLI